MGVLKRAQYNTAVLLERNTVTTTVTQRLLAILTQQSVLKVHPDAFFLNCLKFAAGITKCALSSRIDCSAVIFGASNRQEPVAASQGQSN